MKFLTKTSIAIATGALVLVSGSVAMALTLSAQPDTGTQPGSAPAPSGYSGINDPNLQACMAAKPICNPQAQQELNSPPWAAPLEIGATTIDRSQVEQLVRSSLNASASAPIFTAYMSGATAVKNYEVQRSSNTNESRPVWLVTVVTPVQTDGGPARAPETKSFYSAVVDAATGQITDDCIGCEWLTSSQ